MTLDVYSGLFDDDLDAVASRLDDLLVPRACPGACDPAACSALTYGYVGGPGGA